MADLYSVIPGIQPSQQDVLEAEYLAKQILEAQFPTLDLREGTGLRDLLIRPSATLMAIIKKATDYLLTQNNLNNVDDTTPTELVDNIMSNFFIPRNIGTKSIISARLYFARSKNVGVPSNVYFSTDNILKFYPAQSYTIPSTSMSFDTYSNEYYVDVQLVAEQEGTNYNLSSGSLLYFSNFDPYFLRAEINYLVQGSVPTETNTQFIARAKSAISTRNLINQPSVDFNLRNTFSFLKNILTIGMGDNNMIRDLIVGMLPPRPPIQVSAISITGTTATVTATAHGYYTGELVNLSGASVANINGYFQITVVDANNFTITVPSGTTVPVTLPVVVEVGIQTRLHTGGCSDIYCSNSVSTNIIQVTTDATGKATVTGPVYGISRSSVSGGVSADTIPLLNSVSVPSTSMSFTNNYTAGHSLCTLSSTAQPFVVGDVLTITGSLQTQPISTITCSGLTVTVTTTAPHGYSVGNSVNIAGVTPSTYNGTFSILSVTSTTFTYAVPSNIATAGSGTMTCEVNTLNGTQTVYSTTANSFSVLILNPTAATTGTATVTSPVRYTISNPNIEVRPILSATNQLSGNVSIYMPQHGLNTARKVLLAGLTPAGYNGSWVISSITDQDHFVVSVPTMSADTSTITVTNPTCTSVYPPNDFGFSTKQTLILNFGAAHANGTASFTVNEFNNLDSLQAYLYDPTEKVLCGDLLARGFNIYALDISVVSYTAAVTTMTAQAATQSYLDTLAPGAPFVVAELVSTLKGAGFTDIKLPLGVNYTRYTKDLMEFNYPDKGSIVDVLDPNDATSMFILNSITTTTSSLPVTSAPVVI